MRLLIFLYLTMQITFSYPGQIKIGKYDEEGEEKYFYISEILLYEEYSTRCSQSGPFPEWPTSKSYKIVQSPLPFIIFEGLKYNIEGWIAFSYRDLKCPFEKHYWLQFNIPSLKRGSDYPYDYLSFIEYKKPEYEEDQVVLTSQTGLYSKGITVLERY